MSDEKILKFPDLVEKRWEEINRILVKEFEKQDVPLDVSVTTRKWARKIFEQHLKPLHIPITINIPSAPTELQKKIEESMKESANIFIEQCGRQIFDMFAVMVVTKIECEKAKHDLRLKSFMYD